MPSARTLMGIGFRYSGSLDTGITVHKSIDIYISLNIIKIIRGEIERKSPVLMGACRDNPKRFSIGETLLNSGYSPQNLSYVIPLLIEEGFCKSNNERPYIITKTE